MNLSAFEERISSKPLQPLYMIRGPEAFLRSQALQLLLKKAQDAAEGYDVTRLDMQDQAADRLFDDLRTASLFAPRRMVTIDNAQLLLERFLDLLGDYAEKPSPNTVLVLIEGEMKKPQKPEEEEKQEPRKRIPAEVKSRIMRKFILVDCQAIKDREAAAWCIERARIHGKKIEPSAAKLLAQLLGSNLGKLDSQIERLSIYCKDRDRITGQDVADLVAEDRDWLGWQLGAAVSDRETLPAMKMLQRLIRDTGRAGWITAPLGKEVLRLIQLKELQLQGLPQNEIVERSGVADWLVDKLLRKIKDIPLTELRGRLRMVLEADVESKTGSARDDSLILEDLVLRLCLGAYRSSGL